MGSWQDDDGEGELAAMAADPAQTEDHDYAPHVGEAYDPYAEDPEARREALRPLLLGEDGERPVQAWLGLTRGSAEEKLEHLLSLPQPRETVQALAPDEFALLAKDIGINDAADLLALASPRQLQSLVDLDAWRDGALQPETVLTWMAVAREAGLDTLDAYVGAQEDGLLCLTLLKHLRAVANHAEVDTELPDDMEVFDSPDGAFKLLADPDETLVPLLRDLVDALYRIQLLRGRAVLRSMTWELPSQLEDDLAGLRAARLDQMGFADRDEAMQIYAYRDPHAYRRELAGRWRGVKPQEGDGLLPYVPDDELQRVGLALPADAMQGSFLGRAAQRLPGNELERLQVAMVRLAYRVQSARAETPADLEVLPQWARHALHTAAMGLEFASQGEVAYAAVLLVHEPLAALFHAGHSLAVMELHRGRRLRHALGGADGVDLLEPEDAAMLRAVTAAFPSVAVGDQATRPFETLAELDGVRERLRSLEACVQLMQRLAGGDLRGVRALATVGTLPRLSTLLNTAVAWHVLQGKAELRPLDAPALKAFLAQGLEGRKVRPALRAAVIGGLLSRVELGETEVSALQAFVERALDRLGEELGALSAAVSIDPRFAGDALWLDQGP